jgi:hypothetical protein
MTLQANQRFFVEKLVGWNFSRQIWGRTYRASLPFAPGQSLHRAPATAHPATVTSRCTRIRDGGAPFMAEFVAYRSLQMRMASRVAACMLRLVQASPIRYKKNSPLSLLSTH